VSSPRRVGSRRLLAAAVVAGASLLTSCSWSFGMPSPRTEQAGRTFTLWQVFFVVACIVAAIVYGLIVWSLVRYRRRRSDEAGVRGRNFSQHVPIEIVYTAIPVAIVVVLFGLSVRTEHGVAWTTDHPDVTVHVQGYQWGWRFDYVGQGVELVSRPSGPGVAGPQMVLPLGRTVKIVLDSDDVIHAFWVPDFLFKRDAIPGRTSSFVLSPDHAGTFQGTCAEFCGLNHAYMRFSVRVVSAAQFQAWLASQRSAQAAGTPSPVPSPSASATGAA
jgi:cytochrome c oxidase subunit II